MCKPLALIIVLFLAATAAAQRTKPKVNLARLRSQLSTALGARASIVKDELNQPNDSARKGEYWLVHIQPKSTGHFAVKYRYNYNGKLYSHVERELRFRVGKTGCLRGPYGNGYYSKFCLGDTIILPIALENFTEHEFSLKFTDETIDDANLSSTGNLETASEAINPAATNLTYIGSHFERQLHRAGGYTLERYAVFEAKQPGKLNLAISNSPQSSAVATGGYAVIVVDRNAPLTALLASENVEGFTKGFDGQEYVSSTGSNTSYLTNVIVIQTGDRFTFSYGTEVHSAQDEWKERAEKSLDKPASSSIFIAKLPFSFDPGWGYNGWIAEWVLSFEFRVSSFEF